MAKNKHIAVSLDHFAEDDGNNIMLLSVNGLEYKVNKINASGELVINEATNEAYFAYRMLSASEVARETYRHCDFTDVNLKDYLSLAKGISFFADHNNWSSEYVKGRVVDTFWGEATTLNGSTIPAGINGIIAVDLSSEDNLKFANKIKKGYVAAGSVSVAYKWKKSHNDIDNFYNLIGTKAENGLFVRKVVTEIMGFTEFSGLTVGADSNSQVLNGTAGYLTELRSSSSFGDTEDIFETYYGLELLGADFEALSEPFKNNIMLEEETATKEVEVPGVEKKEEEEEADFLDAKEVQEEEKKVIVENQELLTLTKETFTSVVVSHQKLTKVLAEYHKQELLKELSASMFSLESTELSESDNLDAITKKLEAATSKRNHLRTMLNAKITSFENFKDVTESVKPAPDNTVLKLDGVTRDEFDNNIEKLFELMLK